MAESFGSTRLPRYAIVAWQRRERVLFYHEFGSWQGEWVMLSASDTHYQLYKGWYGSCSGCDDFEASFNSAQNAYRDSDEVKGFVNRYPPFLIAERRKFHDVAMKGAANLLQVMPKNVRDTVGDDGIDWPMAAHDMMVAIKNDHEVACSWEEIIRTTNAEIASAALRLLGYDSFIEQAKPEIVDRRGDDELLSVPMPPGGIPNSGDDKVIMVASVKDASTDRRFLLRVPPTSTSVQAAVAWTFGMSEDAYDPDVET